MGIVREVIGSDGEGWEVGNKIWGMMGGWGDGVEWNVW